MHNVKGGVNEASLKTGTAPGEKTVTAQKTLNKDPKLAETI